MSCNAVVPKRILAVLIALTFLTGTYAAAQVTSSPKNEIYVGYAWLHTNGSVDWGKVPDIVDGFDASITHYFSNMWNLGAVVDGGFHSGSGGGGPNGKLGSNVGYAMAGLQYKLHSPQISPFVRVMGGAANLSPDLLRSEWKPAVLVGGGLDLSLAKSFSIRLAQVDYIWSYYRETNAEHSSDNWNSIRLSAGLILNVGEYNSIPPTAACTAQPTEVWSGDPVKVNATGSNFNPKHTLTYGWTATGGAKLQGTSSQSATVDTTGQAPGSYTANATITDAKMKKNNVASCAANYTVKQPQAPNVSCTANPTTIGIGEPATITMTATDPQGWPLSYKWSATGGQLAPNGTSATLTATNADAGNTITVTGTATDDRANLNASCTATVNVPAVKKCVMIQDLGECTFEKNPKKPWRVDNDCKDVLDKLTLQMQNLGGGKLDIVGYTDEKESVSEQTLGSQRSVNVKYYLTKEAPTPLDPGTIQPRSGGQGTKSTHFYFVPVGDLCGGQAEVGTTVDETQVQPQGRNAKPAPAKKSHKAKKAPAAPAQNQ
jgi:hypothetical protein